jgi:hypothetical protein
MMQG